MPTWTEIYLISEWIVRLIMLVYVPQRRAPAAARTWLLFIFVLPWPGLILYGILGRASMPRRRLEMQHKISRRIRTAGAELLRAFTESVDARSQFAQVFTLAENLGDFPLVGGNRVELLTDYEGTVDRLVDEIAAAERHVHLLYYIFADDATGRKVADALAQATQRGVQCRVLLDSLGSKAARRSLVPRMRAAGIDVHELLPVRWYRRNPTRMDLRNHRKIAVIDGRVAYVGSQNLVDASFKPGLIYEELVARVTGPAVLQLQAVFLADRYLETETALRHRHEIFPEPPRTGTTLAQVLPSGPGYAQPNNQRFIVSLVHSARRRIVMTTPYFIPDEALLEALKTAVQRGVEVHLIVSRQADQWLVCLAQRSYYEELLEGGVRIHLYHERFLHAKHLSIDDSIALIGSSNIDLRSFLLNAEVSLIVDDPEIAAQLRGVQERTMSQSDVLTLDEWRRRPFVVRTLQNVARLFDALL
jgi:cardiolipin synthase